jgi:uncharacterized delta-60 repeat protein
VALQRDGKVVLAGWTTAGAGGSTDVAVLRRNPDGSPDQGFGVNGRRIIDWGKVDRAQDVVLQPDGRIVVAGERGITVAVQRLLANGADDASFNGGARHHVRLRRRADRRLRQREHRRVPGPRPQRGDRAGRRCGFPR